MLNVLDRSRPVEAKELLLTIIEDGTAAYFIKKYFFQAVILMQGQKRSVQQELAERYAEKIICDSDLRIKFYFMFLSGKFSISAKEKDQLNADLFDLLKSSIIYSARYGKHYSSLLPLIEKMGGYDFSRRLHNRGLVFVKKNQKLAKTFNRVLFDKKWREIDTTLPKEERKKFSPSIMINVFAISVLLLFIYQKMVTAEVSPIQLLIMGGLLTLIVTFLWENVRDAIRRNQLEHQLLEIKGVDCADAEQARERNPGRATRTAHHSSSSVFVPASQNFVIEVNLTSAAMSESMHDAAAAPPPPPSDEREVPVRKLKRWHLSSEESSTPVAAKSKVRLLPRPGDFGAEFESLPENQLVKIQGQGLSADATLYGIWNVNSEESDPILEKLFSVFEKGHTVGKMGSGIKKLVGEMNGVYEIKDVACAGRVLGYREMRVDGKTAIIFEDYEPDGIHSKSAVRRVAALM